MQKLFLVSISCRSHNVHFCNYYCFFALIVSPYYCLVIVIIVIATDYYYFLSLVCWRSFRALFLRIPLSMRSVSQEVFHEEWYDIWCTHYYNESHHWRHFTLSISIFFFSFVSHSSSGFRCKNCKWKEKFAIFDLMC